jgi:hypothetical protein
MPYSIKSSTREIQYLVDSLDDDDDGMYVINGASLAKVASYLLTTLHNAKKG